MALPVPLVMEPLHWSAMLLRWLAGWLLALGLAVVGGEGSLGGRLVLRLDSLPAPGASVGLAGKISLRGLGRGHHPGGPLLQNGLFSSEFVCKVLDDGGVERL